MILQVQSFLYLGSTLTEDARCEKEVKHRITIAKESFLRMRNLLCNRSVAFHILYRMVRCYIWAILMYGSETWTLNKTMITRINAFEIWILRRILHISYMEQKSDEDVLGMVGFERKLMEIIA